MHPYNFLVVSNQAEEIGRIKLGWYLTFSFLPHSPQPTTRLIAEPRGWLQSRLDSTTPDWFLATLGRSWGGLSLGKGVG